MRSFGHSPHHGSVTWLTALTLISLLALLAGLFFDARHRISKNDLGASTTYHAAAKALRDGRDPYAQHVGAYSYVYPPLYAFLCRPLADLPQGAAARVMLSVNTAFILAALLVTAHTMLGRLGVRASALNVAGVALSAAAIALVPIHNELRGMETNALMLLCFALALHWLDRRPGRAGLSLALGINIKYLPLAVLPYLLLRRRWAAASATVLWSAALACVPGLSIGWARNWRYLHSAVGGLGNIAGVSTAAGSARVNSASAESSISITSTFARLGESAGWTAKSGLVLGGVVAVAFILIAIRAYRRKRLPLLLWPEATAQNKRPFQMLLATEWAGLITGMLAFSPNTQNRNLVLAAIPVALACVLARFPRPGASRLPACIAISILLVALILPMASMGHHMTGVWQRSGMPCWCLLTAYVILLQIGLQDARAPTARGLPVNEPL